MIFLVAAEQTGKDRDHRRAQGTGGHELENRIRDAERREIGVQLGTGTKLVGDDDDADVAQDARREEGKGDDEARARERSAAHEVVEPAVPDERGCACRYALRRRAGETCV